MNPSHVVGRGRGSRWSRSRAFNFLAGVSFMTALCFAGCATAPSETALAQANFGPEPSGYVLAIKQWWRSSASYQIEDVGRPRKAWVRVNFNKFLYGHVVGYRVGTSYVTQFAPPEKHYDQEGWHLMFFGANGEHFEPSNWHILPD